MGNRLPELFREAGFIGIVTRPEDEVTEFGHPDFAEKTALWTEVMDNVAAQLEASGACTADLLREARNEYEAWRTQTLRRQILSMTAVMARTPAGG